MVHGEPTGGEGVLGDDRKISVALCASGVDYVGCRTGELSESDLDLDLPDARRREIDGPSRIRESLERRRLKPVRRTQDSDELKGV